VHRGKDNSYPLSPIYKDDIDFSEAMIKRIKESRKEAEGGEVTRISTSQQISDLLGL